MRPSPPGRHTGVGVGAEGTGRASLVASQLQRKVQDIVLGTIQNYRADPEETAAEESWDYVQFQVCEWVGPCSPSAVTCTAPPRQVIA